jgi:hypothetical protein
MGATAAVHPPDEITGLKSLQQRFHTQGEMNTR